MAKSTTIKMGMDLFHNNDDYIEVMAAIKLLTDRGFIIGEFDPFAHTLVAVDRDNKK